MGNSVDMEEFKWYSNLFKSKLKIKDDLSQFGTLMILCAGLGKRFSDCT